MSFAALSNQTPQQPLVDDQNVILQQIKQLQDLLDQDIDVKQRQDHLKKCKDLSDKIDKDIKQQIKKKDDKQAYKLLKLYNQQTRRLNNLHVEKDYGEEDEGLLQQEEQQSVDIQIYHESVTERKQRLYNVHKNLSSVKGVFQQIAEITTTQVDKMMTIDQNYGNSENQTKKATQELLKAQQSYKDKLGWRIFVIILLSLIVLILLLK
ncbi:hypothetical protein pb186bvf_004322 [Paramecium bursaria]